MDDFNDYDEMNDIDDPLDGDSDNDNFENIDEAKSSKIFFRADSALSSEN